MIRRRSHWKTIVTAGLMLAPMAACAYNWPANGLYIGAGGGMADNRQAKSGLPAPFVNLHHTHPAWKAFVGYAFNRFFSVQAGYQGLGQSRATTAAGVETVRNRGYDVNGLLTFPLDRRVDLFVEGGVSRFRTRTATATTTTIRHDGTHPDYGGGVQVNLMRHVSFRGEWQEFRIPHNNTQLYSGSLAFRF